MIELLHQNLDTGVTRALGGLVTACTVKTVWKGAPGQMDVTMRPDESVKLAHGDIVALRDETRGIFYGYIFKLTRNEKEEIQVTAYDQLRYLKNKDTYNFVGKRADQIAAQIAADFELKTGELENTGYVIPSLIQDGVGLFDIILEALEQTLVNTGEMFVLWDDYGALRISSVKKNHRALILGDGSLATGYGWESGIDEAANHVKLVRDNKQTGRRDVYVVKDSYYVKRWGVLQHYEKVDEELNGAQIQAQAERLLELKNKPTVALELDALEGELTLRAGQGVWVRLVEVGMEGWYIVEECTHDILKETMKLKLVVR